MIKRILLSIVLLLVLTYLVVAITAFNRKRPDKYATMWSCLSKTQYTPVHHEERSNRYAGKERHQPIGKT